MSDKFEPMNETVSDTDQVETGYTVEPVQPEVNHGTERESLYEGSEFRQQIENGGYPESAGADEAKRQAEKEKEKFRRRQEGQKKSGKKSS